MELDPSLAEAHFVAGDIAFFTEWDWAKSEAEYKRAVELDPTSASAALHYATCLAGLGRWDESITEFHRALHLDPVALTINLVFLNVLVRTHRDDDAQIQFQRIIDLYPDSFKAYRLEAQLKERQGQFAEAIAANLTADRLSAVKKEQLEARTRAATAGGIKGYWSECLREFLEEPRHTRASPYFAAILYLHTGDLTWQ